MYNRAHICSTGQCDHTEILLTLGLPVAPSSRCCMVPCRDFELPSGKMEALLVSGLGFANTSQQVLAAADMRQETIDPKATLRDATKVVR